MTKPEEISLSLPAKVLPSIQASVLSRLEEIRNLVLSLRDVVNSAAERAKEAERRAKQAASDHSAQLNRLDLAILEAQSLETVAKALGCDFVEEDYDLQQPATSNPNTLR